LFRKFALPINLWTFNARPAQSLEDIEPNLQFELDQHAETGQRVTFSKEASRSFLFALSPCKVVGKFRDLCNFP
jgi:transcriptional regulatory protein RtcR